MEICVGFAGLVYVLFGVFALVPAGFFEERDKSVFVLSVKNDVKFVFIQKSDRFYGD